MNDVAKLRQPTCHDCASRYVYEGSLPMKKNGVNMHYGEVFCTYEKKARRFQKRDPKVRVPQWCPRLLKKRKLRIYGFKDAGSWMLHERLCSDLGHDFSPEGFRYAVEHETETELTAKEFLERSLTETDAALLDGITLTRYQVLEIDDGLRPVYLYKTDAGYRYEPHFNAKAAEPLDSDADGKKV